MTRCFVRPGMELMGCLWPKGLGYRAYECELNDCALFRVPGMTSPRERAFVKFLASRCLEGLGDVVELGPFLGALTVALQRGLAKAGKDSTRICVYDQFQVDSYMEKVLGQLHTAGQIARSYKVGDSFRLEFDRIGEGIVPRPEVIEADLSRGVPRQGPIELLVVDAMKDFATCKAIVRSFYADLVPGGFLLHQDFAHYWASWIHLLHYHLRDCFRFEFHVPGTSSVLFRCIRPPTEEEILKFDEELCRETEFIDAAFATSLGCVKDAMSADVQAAHVMAYVHAGRVKDAKAWYDRYTDGGVDVRREMACVRERLQASGKN